MLSPERLSEIREVTRILRDITHKCQGPDCKNMTCTFDYLLADLDQARAELDYVLREWVNPEHLAEVKERLREVTR